MSDNMLGSNAKNLSKKKSSQGRGMVSNVGYSPPATALAKQNGVPPLPMQSAAKKGPTMPSPTPNVREKDAWGMVLSKKKKSGGLSSRSNGN